MKKKKSYLYIIIYGLVLTFILKGFSNIFGDVGDWSLQHTVIPDIFRQLFYSTHKLIPNLIFNLGGGQNIFNFSYYGLCSPFILLTYLFPKLDMKILISILSVFLYLLSGCLTYKFFNNNKYNCKISLIMSIIFLSMSPITFHFHHHIMFVWYYPFLLLSLMGVDKYFNNKKSLLLVISTFFLILTNYYYAVPSILVIGIYSIYKLLLNKDKHFINNLLNIIIRVIVSILLSVFILLPTLYTMHNTKRMDIIPLNKITLFLFDIKNIMYDNYGMGLSLIFIVAILFNLSLIKKDKSKLFLNIVLLIIIFCPFILFILNGFLYVRGKVLIPFIILYLITLCDFINNLNKKINKKIFIISNIFVILYILIANISNYYLIFLVLDLIYLLFAFRDYKKTKKINIIYTTCIISVLIPSLFFHIDYRYLSENKLSQIKESNKNIKDLYKNINDNKLYRKEIILNDIININNIMDINDYKTSLYSSTFNSNYDDFYKYKIGNNIVERNAFANVNAENPLFSSLMGVRYIVSNKKNLDYQKVNKKDNYYLYKNIKARPLFYITDDIGYKNIYNSLSFPENIEYMINNPITNKKSNLNNYNSSIKKIDMNLKKNYKFELKEDKKIVYPIEEISNDKFLIIKFKMNFAQDCIIGDEVIKINGIKNKLTCKDWFYYNNNNMFEYIISSKKNINKLNIKISPGMYDISDIEIYTMDKNIKDFKSVDNLKYNLKDSEFTANVNTNKDSYIISSLPYDKGYHVYIDNKEIKKEKVNLDFLGFKINKGNHKIRVKYISPFYKYGLVISIFGLILAICIYIKEMIK